MVQFIPQGLVRDNPAPLAHGAEASEVAGRIQLRIGRSRRGWCKAGSLGEPRRGGGGAVNTVILKAAGNWGSLSTGPSLRPP
ncbi:hypothetical protein HYQ46_004244 [Verticillium longisporum]|nr:hypothetical protein HYQ46_004244 [Verticillium longisporum]